MGTPADVEELVAYNQNLSLLNVMMLTPLWRGMTNRMEQQAEMVKKRMAWLSNGEIKVHISEVFPLHQAVRAHKCIEAGSTIGKIVLDIED